MLDSDTTPIGYDAFCELVLRKVRQGAPETNILWSTDGDSHFWSLGSLSIQMHELNGGVIVTSNRAASGTLGVGGMPPLTFALNRLGASTCANKIIDDLHNPFLTV